MGYLDFCCFSSFLPRSLIVFGWTFNFLPSFLFPICFPLFPLSPFPPFSFQGIEFIICTEATTTYFSFMLLFISISIYFYFYFYFYFYLSLYFTFFYLFIFLRPLQTLSTLYMVSFFLFSLPKKLLEEFPRLNLKLPEITDKTIFRIPFRKKNEKSLEKYFRNILTLLHLSTTFEDFISQRYEEDKIIEKENFMDDSISPSDFTFIKLIGEGCMGKVFVPLFSLAPWFFSMHLFF